MLTNAKKPSNRPKAKAAKRADLVPKPADLLRFPGGGAGVGPDTYLSRARAQQVASTVMGYARMLAMPFHRDYATRYPDETITPTALTHFAGSYTWSSTGTAASMIILKQDVNQSQVSTPFDFNVPSGPVPANSIVALNYGNQLGSYARVSATQRTLAYGLRARVTGLPPNTFLPSGTVYFLQLQEREMRLPPQTNPFDTLAAIMSNGEQAAIAAVLAGKGFSVTINELSKNEGLHIPYIPSGPQNMDFTDYGSEISAYSGNTNVWSNGGGGPVPAASFPSLVRTAGTNLVIFVFGAQTGVQIRYDYAHHVEYVPAVGAAGLVQVTCADSDAATRDAVHKVSQNMNKQIAGSTSAAQVQNALDFSDIRGTLSVRPKQASLPAWLAAALDFARPAASALMRGVRSGALEYIQNGGGFGKMGSAF